MHSDGHESKPAMCVLVIVQDCKKNLAFRYFATYFCSCFNTIYKNKNKNMFISINNDVTNLHKYIMK